MTKRISVLILLGFLFGCSEEEEFEGPSLNDLYGSFMIIEPLDITDRSVGFSSGETTVFTAQFSKQVNWKVAIKGLSSGAMKEINGFSNALNVENARWNGTTTSLPMFRAEECAVELTFESEPDTLRDTLTVTSGRVNEGFLLSDFENGFPAGWTSFVQSGANMTFIVQNNNNAAQGTRYYDMGGTVNWDWLKGMFEIPASVYGAPRFDLNSNPDAVYFNAMLFKPPAISNSLVLFQFREDDNQDGVYSSSSEDMYSIEVDPTVDGWTLLSAKYADLQTLINGAPAAAIGNGIREPHKCMRVSVLFLANPSSGYTQGYIDYLIFTENGPLQP